MKNFFLRKCSTTLSLEIVKVNSKKNHENRRHHVKSHVRIQMDSVLSDISSLRQTE
jgi:hypothetical protein